MTMQQKILQKWLDEHSIVIAGYFDEVKAVDLIRLIQLWLEGGFAEYYPYAADHFQISVISEEDNRQLPELLSNFKYCYHLRVWIHGKEVPSYEIEQHFL